ncbi:hypothetical protein Bpfe_000757 [Biomphalaria pfeifferi]|uniref:Uncharacterized protein n=1 Tax=Biomphalaria pfeifferi TaxID=112525 RepID=A0AAD8CAW0_BIOPF|nr:hypothetical protein Bpfe_000757 [Biomphalaria pfeifferi]
MIFTRHSPVDLFRLLALMPRIITQTQGQRYKSEILSLTLSQLFISFTLSLVALSQKGSAAISLPSSSSQSPVQLKLNTACNSEAIIESIFQAPNPSILIKCELTYSIVGQNQAQIINIYLDPLTHTFNLFNLSQGVNYSVFLVCDNWGKSKSIFFISGSVCQHDHPVTNETLEAFDTETNAQLSYAQTSSYDAVEWPIAITFAAAGLIICAVVAFYMWKKYQRRQRILRIFRQGQNDPFQALYSPTQDSYSF